MRQAVEGLSGMLVEFVRIEAASAILLIAMTVLALVIANSPLDIPYEAALAVKLGPPWLKLSLLHWINDGLMALFFLLVGLEIKREVIAGALSSFGQAALPLLAALGGVVMPAVVFLLVNIHNTDGLSGWAVPVATDIAFALGILALLGSRASPSLKVFLTALAVLDDLLVVLIIAVFYASDVSLAYLLLAALGLTVLVVLNLLRVSNIVAYLAVGALVWFCAFRSGIHPTLAGVAVAFCIPVHGDGGSPGSPLERLEHLLHPWVAWLIIPLFALANAGVSLSEVPLTAVFGPVSVGIALGLFVGKPLGIFGATWLAARAGVGPLPQGATLRSMHGVATVCGVGFTMSLLIASLAFDSEALEAVAKFGVLGGSLLSGISGYILLLAASRRAADAE